MNIPNGLKREIFVRGQVYKRNPHISNDGQQHEIMSIDGPIVGQTMDICVNERSLAL
jgi:hypothetical protein